MMKNFAFARCILLCDPIKRIKSEMKDACDDMVYKLEVASSEEEVLQSYSKMIDTNKKKFRVICVLFQFECYDESASIVKCIRSFEESNLIQPTFIIAIVEEYSKSLLAQAFNDCKSSRGESRSMYSGIMSYYNDFDDGLSLFNTIKSKMELMQIDGVETTPISKEKLNKYILNNV